uniref:Arabidopsis retrotransposon Orf1 C-terminal domain-containing protein n=1 Tax=Noccaea caerulescens TaxID=107243 RepID=A0A1J3DBX3_NOCCA
MAPRQRFSTRKDKHVAGPSDVTSSTYPWPRPDGVPFNLPDDTIPENSDSRWDQVDCFYYNKLLNVEMEPTRLMCAETLKRLGIHDQVQSILLHAKLMGLALETSPLYPDLARQCLATVRITYANPETPLVKEATLSFFAGGKKYSIPMEHFCDLYGFHSEDADLTFPKKFGIASRFWQTIADGPYRSNSASQSLIRHPAVRICARIISQMFFNRYAGNKVHMDELMLLYYGCREIVREPFGREFAVEHSISLGTQFAMTICAVKDKVRSGASGKTERIGSLLTTLFEIARVPLNSAKRYDKLNLMDTAHLVNSQILRDADTYRFKNEHGVLQYVFLPDPSITQLNTLEDLRFMHAPLQTTSAPHRDAPALACPSSSRAPPPHLEDMETSERSADAPFTTPAYDSEFDLPPISDEYDIAEYRRWMVASQKKNNSLMQRILQMLARGCSSTTTAAAAPSERLSRRRPRTNSNESQSPEEHTTR